MAASIEMAAEFIRLGNHAGAEEVVKVLQSTSSLGEVVSVLQADTTSLVSTYVHFISLKLLRILLVRQHATWVGDKMSVLRFLADYAHALGADRMLSHEWRPAVVELSSCVAVALKLGCVSASRQVDASEVANVVRCLADGSLLSSPSAGGAAGDFLHHMVLQRAVEEFGLFDVASRHRGLPVSVHREARLLFAGEDNVAVLALSLLRRFAARPAGGERAAEQQAVLDTGFGALATCLAWPSHHYFEEESGAEESCQTFTVTGRSWDELFFFPLHGDAGGTGGNLFAVLSSWYAAQSVSGVPVARHRITEAAQLLCAFRGSSWGDQESLAFLTASFALCMNIFESIAVSGTADDFHLLPVLASSLLLLVSNYTEYVTRAEMARLLGTFSQMAEFLISWDAKEDDDNVMSSLDEVLSAWYQLACHADRDGAVAVGGDALRQSCARIFAHYLACKTASCVVDENEDGLADAFTNSHVELVAHIGRVSAGPSCENLKAALKGICDQVSSSGTVGGGGAWENAYATHVNEAVWLVEKVIASFIADKSDGEEPCVPRCFQDQPSAAAVVHLMEALMAASSVLFVPHSCVTSPAVYAAYAEALRAYCRCYVEPEDGTAALFASAIGGGADFVAFALHFAVVALQRVPFEKGTMASVCALLDSIADKSEQVRAFVTTHSTFPLLLQFSSGDAQHKLVGHTRGRVLGFVISCSARPDALALLVDQANGSLSSDAATTTGCGKAVHHLLATAVAQERETPVNELLDSLATVAGLFESVLRQEVVRGVFPPLLVAVTNLLDRTFARYTERELAIEVVQCVHNMFTACVLFLDNSSILSLLRLVVATEASVCQSLKGTSAWLGSADAESDRVTFLSWSARLVAAVSQWKRLDCFLSDEDVAPLAAGTTAMLATLLDCLDQRTLCFPELEETLFLSLEVCTEAFPELVFFSPEASNTFFSATFYALTSDRASTQRAGVAVANHAADCLAQSGCAATGTGTDALLRVTLRSLVTGKVQQRNVRLVARTVLKLARHIGAFGALQELFASTAAELPSGRAFLEHVLADVSAGLQAQTAPSASAPSAMTAQQAAEEFEARLQDHLSLMRGTSLV